MKVIAATLITLSIILGLVDPARAIERQTPCVGPEQTCPA